MHLLCNFILILFLKKTYFLIKLLKKNFAEKHTDTRRPPLARSHHVIGLCRKVINTLHHPNNIFLRCSYVRHRKQLRWDSVYDYSPTADRQTIPSAPPGLPPSPLRGKKNIFYLLPPFFKMSISGVILNG